MPIADERIKSVNLNGRLLSSLIMVSFIWILVILSIEILNPILLADTFEPYIKRILIGSILSVNFIALIIVLTRILNRYSPNYKNIKISLIIGFIISIIMGILLIASKVIHYHPKMTKINDFYFDLIYGMFLFGIIGFLISNIVIRKLRKQNILNSIILLVTIVSAAVLLVLR